MTDHPRSTRTQQPTYTVGDTVTIELPYSEVNMHMQVAGQTRSVRIGPHAAYIQFRGGESPVTHGEAGLRPASSQPGRWYVLQ